MAIAVRAVPVATGAMNVDEQAQAIQNLFGSLDISGRLIQVLPSTFPGYLLAFFDDV